MITYTIILTGRLCRRQGHNKTRSKRSLKVHTKYHANTNRIRKTIQRTINYLNDPFKNIINLSKKNTHTHTNQKKKNTHTHTHTHTHLHIMNLSY